MGKLDSVMVCFARHLKMFPLLADGFIRTYAAERSKSFPPLAGGLRGVWEGHPCPDTPDESGNYNLKCVSPVLSFLT